MTQQIKQTVRSAAFSSFVVGFVALWDAGQGWFKLVETPLRYAAPNYTSAKEVLTIPHWGTIMFGVGAALYLGKLVHASGRDRYAVTLRAAAFAGIWVWFFWGVLSAVSAADLGKSSYSGCFSNMMIAGLHLVVFFRGG